MSRRLNEIRRLTACGLVEAALLLGFGTASALAQQTTGAPGAPDATTTIDGRYLPGPPPQFRGEINPNALQSKPYWPPRIVPPQGAPNVLLIMTDDTGFGAGSTIYQDGWIASTKVTRPPWEFSGANNPDPANNVTWELYDLSKDWTQTNDVAGANPAKLKLMQDLFWVEAAKYNVLPLDTSVAPRVVVPKPSLAAGRTVFTYSGEVTGIPPGDAPSVLNTSYTITADIEIPPGGAEGMINTNGGRFGGYGFYLLKNKPVFAWNLLDLERMRWEGPELSPGRHTVEFDFKYDGLGFATLAFNNVSGIGRGGAGTLKVDGIAVSTQQMDHTVPIILQFDETFDVGADTGTPVNDQDYQIPYRFTGKLDKLTLSIDRPKLTPEDTRRLEQEGRRNNRASE